MKKVISYVLLLIFLYNTGGYYLWFKAEQFHIKSEIRKEIQTGIKHEFLTIITVPVNDESSIKWVELDKEFIFHDEMFDVVKIKSDKKTKQYYCINDKNEKQLIADFIKKESSQKKSENILQKVINNKYQTKPFTLNIFDYFINVDFYALVDHYCSITIDVRSSPPKIN